MSFPISKSTIQEKSLENVISDFIENFRSDESYQDVMNYIRKKNESIEKFLQPGKSDLMNINQLVVLRKWNSYTPILPDKDVINKGGGYFVSFNQIGIVIDPGYNFIDNFFSAGYKVDDIDKVFITHAHDDHTAQLESIFSLLYKRNKDKNENESKKIDLFLNLGSFKKFSGLFDLSKPGKNYYINRINILNEHQIFSIADHVKVFTTRVKHHEMITSNYAIGLTFSFLGKDEQSIILRFTADTGWDSSIEDLNIKLLSEEGIINTDILVCHIGSIKTNELNFDQTKTILENEQANIFYKNHLGLIGVVAQIHKSNPKIAIISEFGRELDAVRIKIAEKIQNELKCPIFSTDINFRIDLDNFFVRCYHSGKYYEHSLLKPGKKKDGSIIFYNKELLTETQRLDENSFIDSIEIFD